MAFRDFFSRVAGGSAIALVGLLTAAPALANDAPLSLHGGNLHGGNLHGGSPHGSWRAPATAAAPATMVDALPEAPDLDAIPFFATGDNAFYVRADAGFGAPVAGSALTANGRFNPVLSGPAIAGVGVGYRFGYLLRADVTAEYRGRADIGAADGVRARLSGVTALANLYADIGTWYGVTPYVGAGAGVAWNRFSGAFGGSDRADFVWALTGGFAIAVTPQVSIDLGYRYLHTGATRSPALALRESGSHDLRIGLRWWFGKTEAADQP